VRVLWFMDGQPQAVRRHVGLGDNPGPFSWLELLAAELGSRSAASLTVAAAGPRSFAPFEENGIRYLSILRPGATSRRGRLAMGWTHRTDDAPVLATALRTVREEAPDVVHVHGTEGPFGLLTRLTGRTPVAVSLQGLLQLYQRVYFSGRTPADVARLVAARDFLMGRGVVHRYLLMRRQAEREERIMREGRWFIGRTEWDRGALAAVNPRAQYFHCDEMMRPEFYAAEWTAAGHDGATIYSTSSAMLFKGTECLLEAVAILRRRGVTGLRLRVGGVPTGSEVDALYRRAARRLAVEPLVEWLGRLDAAQIVGELRAADVFAYPSHIDNSPNALVEAMLVGVPTVASCVGGIPTLMRDGKEGLLVPRGDPVALAGAIKRLLDDRAAAAALAGAARATARARNDPARIVGDTLRIYREIITRGAGDAE